MSDHIPDVTKMIGETPRKDHLVKHAPIGLRPIPAFDQAVELVDALERELNAANERIEALNRGNAAAERILCEAAGVESGRDVLDWIVSAKDRIKRLEEALESIREYWNRDNNQRAMVDACWYAIDKSSEALEAKEAKP
jgi:hypothetical protein